ncbi:alpha/beta hydrolase fold domain-containing protein [Streptomyces sp. p1417]|uniref:Alpha/beta hydrolase fold domain-containing protein n=1 Tax=Streptomyces typhae TaxID=2681492 RepID=A0A6L6WYH2_9ACTN|nr:alpha/beta hydrolase [Streptomyces typhae]MVO86546.1 alpha/beta hydrolase fold domain-containing protein [Streptomyces typhae]
MSDDAAVARDAVEEAAALGHPAVPPDATAAYGAHAQQVIDFYAPRDAAVPERSAPLVVLLHGGAWRAPYDRWHVSPLADFLARRGFAVANVEYRCGAVAAPAGTVPAQAASVEAAGGAVPGGGGPVAGRWPETLDDVAAALDALPGLVRAALPGADPGRIVLTGHSAGGQLALWAAARHVLPPGSPWRLERAPSLRGVVALAPIADLRTADELGVCGGAVRQFLGAVGSASASASASGVDAVEARYAERLAHADPAALVPTGIATTVVQGRTDIVVPPAVADAYADAAAKAGEVVGVTLLEGVGHFPLIDPGADACAVVAEEITQLAF